MIVAKLEVYLIKVQYKFPLTSYTNYNFEILIKPKILR